MAAKKTKDTDKETPLMRQYNSFKSKYPDAILLFRVGDFYETFGSDAILASKILGIVLTKRKNGAAATIELAGFPHHSLDTYLPKLVRAGQRVALCDQLEDSSVTKGTKNIVKRGITELVTPGLFQFSRNPIFLGIMIANIGLFFVIPNAFTLLIISLSTISINTQIRLEEEFLEQEFGNDYLEYTKKVKRWL